MNQMSKESPNMIIEYLLLDMRRIQKIEERLGKNTQDVEREKCNIRKKS